MFYKKMQDKANNIGETTEIIRVIKPIYNSRRTNECMGSEEIEL